MSIGATSYSSTGLFGSAGNGTVGFRTSNFDLMNATGTGITLDLSSIQSIDAQVTPVSWTINNQFIAATNGGTIDLSGLGEIMGPAGSRYKIEFRTETAGSINMTALTSVESASNGAIIFSLLDNSQMSLGNLGVKAANTAFSVDGGSLLQMEGLKANGLGSANIILNPSLINDSVDVLDVNGSVDLGSNITIIANKGATVSIAGDLSYSHIDPAAVTLGEAIVEFDGSGLQQLEVGGTDVGTDVIFLADFNFGFGQMIVGTASGVPGQTEVHLRDLIDNGNGFNGCNQTETLYLFGLASDPGNPGKIVDGLRILNGATLFLDGIQLYASVSGTLVNINSLLGGNTLISFDGGSVNAGFGSDTDDDGVLNIDDNCTLVSNADQRDTNGDGYGNMCDPDLNNDLVVQAADLAIFKPLFFSTDPDADFDGNGRVQAGDLAILKKFFFQPPGPSCVVP